MSPFIVYLVHSRCFGLGIEMHSTKDKTAFILGALSLLALLGTWAWSLWFVTAELHQGNVYRIIYLHVPSAFCAFFCSLLLLIFSVASLAKISESGARWNLWGKSSAEVGLLFTILTLITGAIWGKPTWGTWWTWDARLTTTFVLALLYSAYLLLAASFTQGAKQERACAVMGILIFADVPIIYKSVTWWRTLHQPPSLSLAGSPAMDGDILSHLILSILLMLLACGWLVWQRYANMVLQAKLDQLSHVYLRRMH